MFAIYLIATWLVCLIRNTEIDYNLAKLNFIYCFSNQMIEILSMTFSTTNCIKYKILESMNILFESYDQFGIVL